MLRTQAKFEEQFYWSWNSSWLKSRVWKVLLTKNPFIQKRKKFLETAKAFWANTIADQTMQGLLWGDVFCKGACAHIKTARL